MKMAFYLMILNFASIVVNAKNYDSKVLIKTNSSQNQDSLIQVTASKETESLIEKYQSQHSIFAEIIGAGGFASINYENRFHVNWGIRGGIGYFGNGEIYPPSLLVYPLTYRIVIANGSCCRDTQFSSKITFPLILTYMTNDKFSPSHFESGIGLVVWYGEYITSEFASRRDFQGNLLGIDYRRISSEPGFRFFFPLSIGYRYQPIDRGLFFKVNAYGLFNSSYSVGSILGINFSPWVGLGIGYTFQ
jgi:hypothetical protein